MAEAKKVIVYHTLAEVKATFFPNRPLAELEGRKEPSLNILPKARKIAQK